MNMMKLSEVVQVQHLLELALTVGVTFAVLWAPYLTSPGAVIGVLRRLFPTQRGLYEDYVANFW